jgi:ketosteroid isomerase-like protein
MSHADVEIVRQAVEAFSRNDREATWRLWAEDATMNSPAEWPEVTASDGLDEVRGVFDGFDEAFGPEWPLELKANRLVDAGDGRVLVEYVWTPSGASSGAAVSGEIAGIYHVADGKIAHGDFFMSHEQARKEAGTE